MDAVPELCRRTLPIVIGMLLAAASAPAANKRDARPPQPPVSPLVPAKPTEPQITNTQSVLPAPAVRTLPAPGDPEFEFGGPLRNANPDMAPSQTRPESTNAPAAQVAAPPPATPRDPADPETEWITPDEYPDAPLAVRVIPPPDSVLVPGIFVRHMKVELRNRSANQAVAIRGVHWVHGLRRAGWVKSLSGTSRVTPAGLVIVERGPGASEIWFEHGLLLPGEMLKLNLPLTPQPPGIHVLDVAFATVGDAQRSWRDEVLILASHGDATDIFDAPADRSIQERAGHGGIGLLRGALKTDAPEPHVVRLSYRVGLPLARGDWLHQITGGLAMEKALSLAGLGPEDPHLAYFVDPLAAWIIIRPSDGDARALLQDGDKWTLLKGCRMDVAAPDLMCSAPDRSTPALLDPNTFADIVKVQTPWVGKRYNPGKTYLKPDALRAVLRRAAERATPIRVATIDPNGLGLEEIMTIGVRVDVAGRWLSPSIGSAPGAPGGDASRATPAPGAATPIAGPLPKPSPP